MMNRCFSHSIRRSLTTHFMPALIFFLNTILGMLLCGCPPVPSNQNCISRRGGENLGFQLELITVVSDQQQTVAYGLRGAAQNAATFFFNEEQGVANDDGSFELVFAATLNEDALLQNADKQDVAYFPVVDAQTIAKCLLGETLTTGQTPNQVRFGKCDDEPIALVIASADASVDRSSSDNEKSFPSTLFPPIEGVGAGPYHLHVADDKTVVSLFGAHEVALLSTCDGEVLARSQQEENPVINVQPLRELDSPIDALFDGNDIRSVDKIRVRHPQGVVLLPDGSIVAAFTNLLQPAFRSGEKQVLGKSVLVRFVQEDRLLRPASHVVLDVENVQSLTYLGEGTVVASATGAFSIGENGLQAQTDAGSLIFFTGEALEVSARIPLPGFAPGTPFVDVNREFLLVGSLLQATVRHIRIGPDFSFSEGPSFVLGSAPNALDSIFELSAALGGVVLAPQFNDDKLFALVPQTGSVLRIPGVFPVDLSGGTSALRGPLSLSSTLDAQGDLKVAVLLTFSSEVKMLHFDRVFGATP